MGGAEKVRKRSGLIGWGATVEVRQQAAPPSARRAVCRAGTVCWTQLPLALHMAGQTAEAHTQKASKAPRTHCLGFHVNDSAASPQKPGATQALPALPTTDGPYGTSAVRSQRWAHALRAVHALTQSDMSPMAAASSAEAAAARYPSLRPSNCRSSRQTDCMDTLAWHSVGARTPAGCPRLREGRRLPARVWRQHFEHAYGPAAVGGHAQSGGVPVQQGPARRACQKRASSPAPPGWPSPAAHRPRSQLSCSWIQRMGCSTSAPIPRVK